MSNLEINQKNLIVFDEYINQLEKVISETPIMGSFLETDIALYCKNKSYDFAIEKDLALSEDMEKILEKRYLEGFTVKKENDSFQLRKSSGSHSEFHMYFFQKVN